LLLYLNGDVALVAEMERSFRLMEEVLRYLIVKSEEGDIEAFQQGGESEQEQESAQADEPEQEEEPKEEPAEDHESDSAAKED
ncbi:MAG: hypothetical protein P8Y09_06020, partial [Deltaproteobacteria bacterium]